MADPLQLPATVGAVSVVSKVFCPAENWTAPEARLLIEVIVGGAAGAVMTIFEFADFIAPPMTPVTLKAYVPAEGVGEKFIVQLPYEHTAVGEPETPDKVPRSKTLVPEEQAKSQRPLIIKGTLEETGADGLSMTIRAEEGTQVLVHVTSVFGSQDSELKPRVLARGLQF